MLRERGVDGRGGGRPLARRVLGAGLRRRARSSPTRCAWCTCAASSCRRRCPRAWARWRPSSGSTRRRWPTPAARRSPDASDACQPANFNGAGQVVVAGHKGAVERAMALAKQKGAKLVKALPVSAPFHSALMAPAAEKLRAELERVKVAPLRHPRGSERDRGAEHGCGARQGAAGRAGDRLGALGGVGAASWRRWASTRRTRSGRARCWPG